VVDVVGPPVVVEVVVVVDVVGVVDDVAGPSVVDAAGQAHGDGVVVELVVVVDVVDVAGSPVVVVALLQFPDTLDQADWYTSHVHLH